MYYDKQIHYIDYLENGEKKYNCGYVKITVSDSRLVLEMQIKGLYETDDMSAEVMLEGAGTEYRIGSVLIRQGSGSFCWEIRDPVKEGAEISVREGLRYGQLQRIHVQLSPRRSLQCVWRKSVAPMLTEEVLPGREEEELPIQTVSVEKVLPEHPISEEGGIPEPEPNMQEIPPTDIPAEALREPAEMADAAREISGAAVPEQPEIRNEDTRQEQDSKEELGTREAQRRSLHGPRTAAMSENKWRQLWRIYPHIRPFRDEREYLSLWPEDFVVLRSDAYRLAHNSFLLHGYYNYEHLILTQMSVKGTDRYYIGVPGNFYEKEKQVAIMFGFESFECRQEPAQEGDFGYYMIRVEL